MQASVMACRTLLSCLDTALHALSPFMPFVTEELYHYLPRLRGHHHSESIMVAPYPTPQQVWFTVYWLSAHLLRAFSI
jgi:valyl-tRNA synthetase